MMAEEFMRGVGPLLSVRGKSILSWIGDDNFAVGDETTSTHEASFLPLNLHALAEQLAKVDVSERLFIEVDLLATELACSTFSWQISMANPIKAQLPSYQHSSMRVLLSLRAGCRCSKSISS